jgi:hypothetical protein
MTFDWRRFLRMNNVFYALVAICIFYLLFSNFLFNAIMNNADSNDDRTNAKHQDEKKHQSYQDEIVLIRRKIFELENELDQSIKNVQNLSLAIRKYNTTVYDEILEVNSKSSASNETKRRKNVGENTRLNRIAVLMFACNRAKAADDHLKDLFAKRASAGVIDKFPIIVSQDCNHEPTSNAIRAHSSELYAFLQVNWRETNFLTIQFWTFDHICPPLASRS